MEATKSTDFLNLVQSRRSIRGFDKTQDVSDEAIQYIINCARWAPSGGNGQPWEFLVIRDETMRNRIADLYLKQHEMKREMEQAARGIVRMTGSGFRNAPVYILILGDPRVNQCYPIRTILEKGEQHFITGVASATYGLHLAAASLGLVSQYVSDVSSPYMQTMLKVWLKIPDPVRIYEMAPIGYPIRRLNPTPRRPLEEIIHYESYDPERIRTDADVTEFLGQMSRLGAYGRTRTERGSIGFVEQELNLPGKESGSDNEEEAKS